MGFEEITQEEINEIPEIVKLPSNMKVIDFRLLMQARKFDFRSDSSLLGKIEKEFSNGLTS